MSTTRGEIHRRLLSGRLLHGLDGLGDLKTTIVIITSDHGESLGDHGLSFHGAALYWDLVHVPLIIYSPGQEVP